MSKKVLYVIIAMLILILLASLVLVFVMSDPEVDANENENTAKETAVSEQSSEEADISLDEETLVNDDNEGESIEPNDTKPMEDHIGTESVPAATEKDMKPEKETTPAKGTEEETEEITTEETTSPTNPTLVNDNDNGTSWG